MDDYLIWPKLIAAAKQGTDLGALSQKHGIQSDYLYFEQDKFLNLGYVLPDSRFSAGTN